MDDATKYPLGRHHLEDRAAEYAPRAQWTATNQTLEQALAAPMGPKRTALAVTANHGRWLVECPDCHGAQLASRDDKRFMCCDCGNESVGGKWRPVTWPAANTARAVEKLLDLRPARHRSWSPAETVDQLRAENYALGLGD